MKTINQRFMGPTRYWWLIMCVGILTVICGFAYWFWPVAGFAIASQLFGWLLILAGIVQLCVAAGRHYPKGWGWWIAGGIIDMFVGFMMVRSIILSEVLMPYFLAFIFLYWGISAVVTSVNRREEKGWWLYLINGILLMILGFLLIESGWVGAMEDVSFLTAIAFIYWGFSISMISYDLKPAKGEVE